MLTLQNVSCSGQISNSAISLFNGILTHQHSHSVALVEPQHGVSTESLQNQWADLKTPSWLVSH